MRLTSPRAGGVAVLCAILALAAGPLRAQDSLPPRARADSARADSARRALARDDSARTGRSSAEQAWPGLRFRPSRVWPDSLAFAAVPALSPVGRLAGARRPGEAVAAERAMAMQRAWQTGLNAIWGQTASRSLTLPDATRNISAADQPRNDAPAPAVAPTVESAALPAPLPPGTQGVTLPRPDQPADTNRIDLFGNYADLGMQLQSRLEAKMERNKNERCRATEYFNPIANCRGSFQPTFDFQFNVRTGGVVAERVHVNVDYDSQREFDASNNISVYYEGKSDELIEKLEVGNVSFSPPPSRFITAGIPSGNYGLQASGQLGPMRFRTILAQQKGNVVKDHAFTIGDRTLQSVERDIDDYKIESRRFFFTVDPRLFTGYPNIDILDNQRLATLAATLPDSIRPTKIYVYRLRIGSQPPNPNGPQFYVRGAHNPSRGPIYEYLREGVDYYKDPSNLWIALVSPLNLQNERLAVAYTVSMPGGRTVNPTTGGTPDLEFRADSQFANLLWDPEVAPGDSAFYRQIRSVYRLGGEDIRRQTVSVKIATGNSGDLEKPPAGNADTYLAMFGIAQSNSPSTFDVDNRLWPRPGDPNINQAGGGAGTRLIRDNFLIFPSVAPFARAGLVTQQANPANDTIYSTPEEDLYSTRHPQTTYHIRVRYDAEGGGDAGSLTLGSVQVRQNSERIVIDGVVLKRDVDYTVDYGIGRVSFSRPDTLFPQPRQVTVQYEENPLFAAAPTSIFGIASEFPLTNGAVTFTAISQTQKSTFNRPPLGFEPASSLVAGVTGQFHFDASPLSKLIERLPFGSSSAASTISLAAEFATSRPQPNAAGQAYVEAFEGEGGVQVALGDPAWYYSSIPPMSFGLSRALRGAVLDTSNAATMAWQSNGSDIFGNLVFFNLSQIDPNTNIIGGGIQTPEPMLWLTLYPRSVGGQLNTARNVFQWKTPGGSGGRRWRSIRASLSPSGVDMSRIEQLEFWVLVNTETAKLARNPTLVFDFGDISENSVVFEPTTLQVAKNLDPATADKQAYDSLFTGRRLAGIDSLDTERDPFSRSFDAGTNDLGLPGDRVHDLHIVVDTGGPIVDKIDSLVMCIGRRGIDVLGDTRSNCTVRNARLDEEDLDQNSTLNPSTPDQERWFRYVVDLTQTTAFNRIGGEVIAVDPNPSGGADSTELHWVQVRIPFRAPTDSLNGPNIRRIKSLRITMVSGEGAADTAFTRLPIARLKLIGSPWLKRAERMTEGAAGERTTPEGSYVIASIIGTQDRDSTTDLTYVSPPGVIDEPDTKQTGLENQRIQINERSLRLIAGVPGSQPKLYDRAEAYYRFPEGQKNFMGYKQLRVWAKGRGNGWGQDGDLQFFVKLGRDASNFYFYRTPVGAGEDVAGWLPEVKVDFERFYALRTQLQNAFLHNGSHIACTGTDSALVAASGFAAGTNTDRLYAACDNGYMVVTIDPTVSPPNLAAVQEMSVGMVRVGVGTGTSPILSGDSLELWVDDIRLTDVVDTPGYAGQLGLSISAGDLADVRVNVSHRDPNFRQLAEQPSFVTDNAFDVGTSVHLDRFLPRGFGYAVPLSVSFTSTANDPFFVSRSDVRGAEIKGLRTPQNQAMNYSIGFRRVAPVHSPLLGLLLNNLGATGSYSTADSRSEYQIGGANSWSAGLDYNVAAQPRIKKLPGWMDRGLGLLPDFMEGWEPIRALRAANIRWNPAVFRVTSAMVKNTDRRTSFLKPAEDSTDIGTTVRGLSHLWRNGTDLELRPMNGLTARWTLASLRDLRDYGDTSSYHIRGDTTDRFTSLNVGAIADAERSHLGGLDVGLERERNMSAALSVAPVISPWIRPRLDFSTQYSMTRDPNTRQLLRTGDSTGAYRLPRRLGNSQSFNAATTIDLARGLIIHSGDSSFIRRLSNMFQPVDVSYSRTLTSSYDGTPFTPGLGYQFGIGGVDAFRSDHGRLASSAGFTNVVGVNHSVSLPFGISVGNRYQRTYNRNWTRRLNNTQGVADGRSVSFPNLSLRWSYRPMFLKRVISSIGVNSSIVRDEVSSFRPSEVAGGSAEIGNTVRHQYPTNLSIAWAFAGGFTTAVGFRTDGSRSQNPGGAAEDHSVSHNFDVGKAFKLPSTWKLKSDLRTRLAYQDVHAESFVLNRQASNQRSALADNGRQSYNLNVDTDVAENLTFSITGARIVSFDNKYDRRFTQTVLTAVLQLSFFAGELR